MERFAIWPPFVGVVGESVRLDHLEAKALVECPVGLARLEVRELPGLVGSARRGAHQRSTEAHSLVTGVSGEEVDVYVRQVGALFVNQLERLNEFLPALFGALCEELFAREILRIPLGKCVGYLRVSIRRPLG